jgi:hypothetical protein
MRALSRWLLAAVVLVSFLAIPALAVAQAADAGAAFPLADLLFKLAVVLSPVLSSLVVKLLNARDGMMREWDNWLKQVVYLVMSGVGAWVGLRFGFDMSGVSAFVGSVLSAGSGLLLFHFGKGSAK